MFELTDSQLISKYTLKKRKTLTSYLHARVPLPPAIVLRCEGVARSRPGHIQRAATAHLIGGAVAVLSQLVQLGARQRPRYRITGHPVRRQMRRLLGHLSRVLRRRDVGHEALVHAIEVDEREAAQNLQRVCSCRIYSEIFWYFNIGGFALTGQILQKIMFCHQRNESANGVSPLTHKNSKFVTDLSRTEGPGLRSPLVYGWLLADSVLS